MVSVRRLLFLLIVPLVLTASLRGQTSITLTKPNAQDVLVTINGTGPFDVFRSQSADLTTSTETLSTDQAATAYTDPAAQQATAVVYFYDVVGPDESSLATSAGGNPQEEVRLDSLSPNAGAEAATVVIAGKGFSQHYPENLVTFNGRIATVNSGTATSLNVTVPTGVGVSSGPVQVRVGRVYSNTLHFGVTAVTGFTTLMGIATYPATNHLFVIDTQASPVTSSLIKIDPFASWTKTPVAGLANIRGLPRMSNNRLFYSNASSANSNQGTIRYYDLASPGEGTWPVAAGVGTSDPVACVSMGTSPASTNYVFFADRRNNEIRRIGDITGRTTYATGFSFPNNDYGASNVAGLAGMAFDSNGTVGTKVFGDLYVSSGSSLLKVTQTAADPDDDPDVTTVTTVVSSPKITEPAGLYFDETRTLHITDKGAGAIALYHPLADPLRRFVKRVDGLTSPRMATLGQSNTTPPETRLYVAEKTRVVAMDDQRLELLPRENIQALISNCPQAGSTPGCAGAAYPSAYQTTPGQVRVEARVYPPRAGVTIHFETIDPPSTAPYDTGTDNDNHGPLLTPVPTSAVTDADGVATTILRFSATSAAGDNFRLLARFASGAGQPVIAQTGIVTAWKRVFIEMDRMCAVGSGLQSQTTGGSGNTVLEVNDTAPFFVNDAISVFDAVNDKQEVATIVAMTSGTPGTLELNRVLPLTFTNTNDGFVCRNADGFYTPDISALYRSFDDGFAELVFRPDGSHVLPFKPLSDLDTQVEMSAFSLRWFRNGAVLRDGTNYIHILGVNYVDLVDTQGVALPSQNWQYIASGAIVDDCLSHNGGNPCSQQQVTNYKRFAEAHETGHQFGVAVPDYPLGMGPPAWCSGPPVDACDNTLSPMEYTANRLDDVDEFGASELGGTAPSIRRSQGSL